MEELDDYVSQAERYSIHDLYFTEDENNFIDNLTIKFNQEEIHNLIGKEVTKLPVKSRTIMDLFLVNQMTVNEIASVKKIPEQEVECIIEQVSKDLKKKLISKL